MAMNERRWQQSMQGAGDQPPDHQPWRQLKEDHPDIVKKEKHALQYEAKDANDKGHHGLK